MYLMAEVVERKKAANERARQELLARTRVALAELARRVPLSRAYIFGSLVRPGTFVKGVSDVDVAFEGLANEHFWAALAFLSSQLGVDVDAVRLEDLANSYLAAKIKREGILWTRDG